MAKEPVPGRVKTRLVPPCTPRQAAALAEAALADTLHTVLAAPARRRVLVLEGEPGPWLPAGFDMFLDHVVPILRKRGLFRSEYSGSTLRENLGLPRPRSLFEKT